MTMTRPRAIANRLGLLALAGATLAQAAPPPPASTRDFAPGQPLDIVIYDRTSSRSLALHEHRGEFHVAGEPGHEYEIRLRNAGNARVLAVTSVDGINVVTGRTAAVDQRGYVLDPGSSTHIDGWRKNLGEVASFFFTTPRRSYAARTGRPDDVGVIGVAMFREAPAATAPQAADAATGHAPERRFRSADSAQAEPQAAAPALGTGHGTRRDSPVMRTTFERASPTPDAVVRIYYDSQRALVARGVIAPEPRLVHRRPEAFPEGFVPDP
jgi:hypothetical protein